MPATCRFLRDSIAVNQSDQSRATLFRSVDVAVLAGSFTERLRSVGIDVGLAATHRFAASLEVCPASDSNSVYWVARICFVNDPAQIELFNAIFALVFDNDGLPIRPKERNVAKAQPATTGTLLKQSVPVDGLAEARGRFTTSFRPSLTDDEANDADDGDEQTGLPEIFPSDIAAFADEPFDRLSTHDLDTIGVWLEQAVTDFLTRPSRRYRRSKQGGATDLRRTMLAARATYGEPVRVLRRAHPLKPRRVVMIGDVSGSMQSFTRIYLHLMRALVRVSDAEVFTFATSLRRVTVQLRDRDPQAAIDRMSAEVADRFSGTRIASSLGELLASPVWSSRTRGAVVLIASDGWEAEHADDLARTMQRLQRLAHRVIWVNPRSGVADFEPLTIGMASALPYVDSLLSGHTLRTMHDIITEIGELA